MPFSPTVVTTHIYTYECKIKPFFHSKDFFGRKNNNFLAYFNTFPAAGPHRLRCVRFQYGRRDENLQTCTFTRHPHTHTQAPVHANNNAAPENQGVGDRPETPSRAGPNRVGETAESCPRHVGKQLPEMMGNTSPSRLQSSARGVCPHLPEAIPVPSAGRPARILQSCNLATLPRLHTHARIKRYLREMEQEMNGVYIKNKNKQ